MKLFEPNVLILDEDHVFSHELKRQLNDKSSSEVKVFDSVIDCLNRVKNEPDVVFIQHKMVHIDGIRASRMLKKKWKHTRIVLLCMSHTLNKKINKKKFGISKAMLKTSDYDAYVKEVRFSRVISLGKRIAMVTAIAGTAIVMYSIMP